MRYFWLSFLVVFPIHVVALGIANRYTEPAKIVAPGVLPWVVKITSTSNTFTGVLISERQILTSAHCLDSLLNANCLKAHFKNAKPAFSIQADRYILHPKFDTSQNLFENYDVAIIELVETVPLSEKGIVLPIIDNKTYSITDLYEINPVFSAGYTDPNILRKISLTWLSFSNGVYELSYSGTAEYGDSGGPLFYYLNDTLYLLGITYRSFIKDGDSNFYEAISTHLEFVSNNIDLGMSWNGYKSNNNWKDAACIDEIGISVGVSLGVGTTLLVSAVILAYKYLKKTR